MPESVRKLIQDEINGLE
jgi:ATP-dependent Lon protease